MQVNSDLGGLDEKFATIKWFKELGIQPGASRFDQGVLCNKLDGLGPFNIALYWKRKYRKKATKDPWHILTNLSNLKETLGVYRCRWGIEQIFKDYKTGGFHMEDTKVNDTRFLALVLLVAMA